MLSVVILTRNEEKNIIECLQSIAFADEILLIDDNSSDNTIKLAKNLKLKNLKIIKKSLDNNFSNQRNFALSKVGNDWVLFIDADEQVSGTLAQEIMTTLKDEKKYNGYFIKRTDIFFGKKLNYGETSKMKLLRLGNKRFGSWKGTVHEKWEIDGLVGELKHEMLHCPHKTIREFLSEINYYTDLRAHELSLSHTTIHWYDNILYPFGKFILNYFLKLGFLDGVEGLIFALMMSFHSFLVRSKLYSAKKNA